MRLATRFTLYVLGFCVLVIAVAGVWFLRDQQRYLRAEAEKSLTAISRLKLKEIADWRRERLGDAAVLGEDPLLAEQIERCLAGSESVCQGVVKRRFAELKEHYGYTDVSLLDRSGRPHLCLSGDLDAAREDVRQVLPERFDSLRPVISPLHLSGLGRRVHLHILAPVLKGDGSQAAVIGAVALRYDASNFLFPLIQRWPGRSASAETLLVRRDGDGVLFLNELRHKHGAALSLRIPMTRVDLPAVMAVEGRSGLVSGRDYRGVEVLAMLSAVPGSGWFMVTKVDADEALAASRMRSTLILGAVFALLAVAIGSMVLVWQRDSKARLEATLAAKRAQEHSERRYRRLFEEATVGIFKTNSKGEVIEVNPAMAHMLGFDGPAEAIEHYSDLGAQLYTDQNQREQFIQRLREDGRVSGFEYEARKRDGAPLVLNMSARIAEREPDGTFTIEGFTDDVTERHRAEGARLELEEQLRVSQKIEAIGQLAGGVAHDFNNLITVILSYTNFAIEELREEDPMRADLEEVHTAAMRASVLTRQLLAFSRRQVLEPKVLNINTVLTDLEKMLKRVIGEDIEISMHPAPDLGNTEVDRGQLEQVIVNLAVNARDAMPDGGKLTLGTKNATLDEGYADEHHAVSPGEYVMLSVSDSGCGMDAETRQRVFEPFFTTKGKGKGTGLGLSTVYGIVKQSGGNIWVYSEPGAGTTFKIYLPLVAGTVDQPMRAAPPGELTGDETVLVVEDEDAVRKIVVRILTTGGYEVLEAAKGEDALSIGQQHPGAIDLLVTDVIMPQMSGKQLADRLVEQNPKLKVLFMSGYTDNAIVHHGVLDPGTKFIGKPFGASALARKVREVLDEDAGA